ncbi:MAG: N-acetyltransferase [Acidimicrobiales bacterium]|nr:N-acetyltransferase [Acidimicrobiales bacterium]
MDEIGSDVAWKSEKALMGLTSPDFRNSSEVFVRLASLEDSSQISAIYNNEVLNTTSTFDLRPRTKNSQDKWIQNHQGVYPANVVIVNLGENNGIVAGFGALSPFRDRPGYSTTCENSIYVDSRFRGKQIGSLLLVDLIERAKLHGFHSMIARISGNNEASIKLHKKHGFELVGTEKEVGRKFGKWLDVTIYQLIV